MIDWSYEAWARSLHDVGVLLCFRLGPMAAYATGTRRLSGVARGAIAVTFVLFVALVKPWTLPRFLGLALACVWFSSSVTFIPSVATMLRKKRCGPAAAFALCAGLFFVVPAVCCPLSMGRAMVLVLAWDLTLSSYSYCVDTSRAGSAPSPADCAFFLLVNPVLVFADRGRVVGPPRLEGRALARMAAGSGVVLVAFALFLPLKGSAEVAVVESSAAIFSSTKLLAVAFRFLGGYATHSGLASIQIGAMRLLGHEIPERYDWPLLARSPQEFWRRWNTYVNRWLVRYVFAPAVLRCARRTGKRSDVVSAGGVLLAFAVAGLLHDAYDVALSHEFGARHLIGFLAAGVVLIGWAAAERGIAAVRAPTPRPSRLLPVCQRVAFWATVVALIALVRGPA